MRGVGVMVAVLGCGLVLVSRACGYSTRESDMGKKKTAEVKHEGNTKLLEI